MDSCQASILSLQDTVDTIVHARHDSQIKFVNEHIEQTQPRTIWGLYQVERKQGLGPRIAAEEPAAAGGHRPGGPAAAVRHTGVAAAVVAHTLAAAAAAGTLEQEGPASKIPLSNSSHANRALNLGLLTLLLTDRPESTCCW